MTRPSIDVVFFDLGNVILPFNHYQIADKLARFSQGKDGPDPASIFSFIFDLPQGAINPYETGRISSVQFFQSVKDSFHLRISFDEFSIIWNDIFEENHEVSEIIRSLKGEKRLGLLSNTNPLHFDYCLSRFPILHAFERWILQ